VGGGHVDSHLRMKSASSTLSFLSLTIGCIVVRTRPRSDAIHEE
jgi:hypothetical protein